MTYTHATRPQISTGTRLNGIYEIDRLIGVGGMGEIYKGHAIETGDPVAIKLMLPDVAENDVALALFRREASALHHLMHDAIVRYYVFTVEPVLQRPYLAMEFVNGRSLSAILQDDGALSFELACSLMRRVASGLHAAHERGIIHRDVSPDNIIVPDGNVARAKIIDFGIARSTQLSEGTVIGSGFAGKYNYVSPEQLGLYGGDVTAKSDIYSLGLVMVQALTGTPLDMGGSQVQVVEKRRNIPDISAIDARIRPLVENMLQPEPGDRPELMAAVAAWSFEAQPAAPPKRGRTVPPRAVPPRAGTPARAGASAEKPKKGRLGLAIAALLAIAVIGAAGGGYYYLTLDSNSTPSSPLNNTADLSLPTVSPQSPSTPQVKPNLPVKPKLPEPSQPSTNTSPPATPGPKTATLPPTPSTGTRTPDQIKRYIEDYNGGDCFFVMPVAVVRQRALLEGFAVSLEPFNTLDAAFKRDIGFTADINARQVTNEQCPVITFLSRLRAEHARAPQIGIDKTRLRSGELLTGMVDRYGNRNVELLLVSDAGTVQNISGLLKQGIDAKTFSIGLQPRGEAPGSYPQLLVAVTSSQPLKVLQFTQPTSAQQLFPAIIAEAEQSKQRISVAARYFRLDH